MLLDLRPLFFFVLYYRNDGSWEVVLKFYHPLSESLCRDIVLYVI